MADSRESFGELVRRRRALVRLTQEQLAERTGLSVRTICNIERGSTSLPRRTSVNLLKGALGLAGTGDDSAQARDSAGVADAVAAGYSEGMRRQRTLPVTPQQLPTAVRHFVGRVRELQALDELLDQLPGCWGGAGIAVVGGTAGIGKTTLAVHWAHKVAGHFPDGQLYLDLRGFDPSGAVVSPAEAIRRLLDSLGVATADIPVGLEAQAALYRSVTAGKRMLVLLDNALDGDQIRPLLPGGPGCLALVTSRTQLTSLVATSDARPLTLGLLACSEARELLVSRLGPDRVSAESAAIDQLIGLCARLPLALAIVAARAALGPPDLLTALTSELPGPRGRLAALDAGDPAHSTHAVFSWSYRRLSPAAARMFRLLGLHPGPDISIRAAASLAGVSQDETRRTLLELARANLVSEDARHRHAFHDLLRSYAGELADATDSETDRREAFQRLIDYYLRGARAARELLHPSHRSDAPAVARVAGVVEQDFADSRQALDWFEVERPALIAIIAQAAAAGLDAQVVLLASHFGELLRRNDYWADLATVVQAGVAAAERTGDHDAQARGHRMLGEIAHRRGATDQAREEFDHAMQLACLVGDLLVQGRIVCSLAYTLIEQGNFGDGLLRCVHALELFESSGDECGQATMLNNIGWCHANLGRYEDAADYCRRSIALSQKRKDLGAEASAWDTLGWANYCHRDYVEAISCLESSIAMSARAGAHRRQAESLAHLGDVKTDCGDRAGAEAAWLRAMQIIDDMHDAAAEEIRRKLRACMPPDAPSRAQLGGAFARPA